MDICKHKVILKRPEGCGMISEASVFRSGSGGNGQLEIEIDFDCSITPEINGKPLDSGNKLKLIIYGDAEIADFKEMMIDLLSL